MERVSRADAFATSFFSKSLPNISYSSGDVRALPFANGSFHIIFSVEANGIFFRKCFGEVKRVLVSDGLFLYTTILTPERHEAFHRILTYDRKVGGFNLCGQREISHHVDLALVSQQEERRRTIWDMMRRSYYLLSPFYSVFAEAMRIPGTWHYQNFALDQNEIYQMFCFSVSKTMLAPPYGRLVDPRKECARSGFE